MSNRANPNRNPTTGGKLAKPDPTSPLSRSFLFTILFTSILIYFTAWPALHRHVLENYGFDLSTQTIREVNWSEVDWSKVGQGVWGVLDPRKSFQRGQWLGWVIRTKGGEVVRQVRERLEL